MSMSLGLNAIMSVNQYASDIAVCRIVHCLPDQPEIRVTSRADYQPGDYLLSQDNLKFLTLSAGKIHVANRLSKRIHILLPNWFIISVCDAGEALVVTAQVCFFFWHVFDNEHFK